LVSCTNENLATLPSIAERKLKVADNSWRLIIKERSRTALNLDWAELHQGCLMAYFQTKNPNLSNFFRVLQWKIHIGIFYAN
jgi:hypothetical protein